MLKKPILHILLPDKFTTPLIHYLNEQFPDYPQYFLCIAKSHDSTLNQLPNVISLSTPHLKHFLKNKRLIFKHFRKASKIIIHGNPVLYFFFLFPFVLKKTFWVIYGGADLGSKEQNEKLTIHNFIKKKVLKKIHGHITHIAGDSEMANQIFRSKAIHFYSPMYLSNTININDFELINNKKSTSKKILIGNSADPSNCHEELFEMLASYKNENVLFYCPLSYGNYPDYKQRILNKGKSLFGEKFIAIIDFMTLKEYRNFLGNMDIAVFNHKRQEAMGVTTSLLAMDKIVYLYPDTTAFRSFVKRGLQVFDNQLVRNELLAPRNVSENRALINQHYSPEMLKSSWQKIYDYQLN